MSDNKEKKKLTLLQILMMMVAFPVMLVREPLVSWYTRTYKREDSGDFFRKFLGIVSALGLGIGRGYSMSAFSEPSTWQSYLGPSLGMAVLGFYVIFPLFYLKAYKGATKLWDRVDSEEYTDEKGRTRRSTEKSWLTNLLMFVSKTGAVFGSIYTGWLAGNAIIDKMPHIGGWLLGVPVAILAAIALGVISVGLLSMVGLRALALAFGAYASQAAAPYIQSLGMPADATGIANFFAFVASVGYVFPAGHILLSRGLKRLVTEMARVYDEKDQNYRNVFEHTFNILESTFLAQAVVGMTGAIALGVQSAIGAVVFLLSYVFVGALVTSKHKPTEENQGNDDSLRCASGLVAAHFGWFQGASYLAAGGSFGVGGAIGAGVLYAALSYLLLFPALYVAIKFFLKPLAHPAIGKFLVTMYDQVVNVVDKVDEMRKDVYSAKPSAMKTLVQQSVNLAVAQQVVSHVHPAAVKFALALPKVYTDLAFPEVTTVVAAVLSYLVIGRVLTKEKIRFFGHDANGMTVLGMLTGISAALLTGIATLKTSSMAIAVILGLIVGSLTTAWLFPLAFGIFAALLSATMPRLTSFVSKSLAELHRLAWTQFKSFVTMFVNAYRAVRDGFKNVWTYIVKTWKESYQSLKEELDRLLGRKGAEPKSEDKDNTENDQ